MPYTKVNVTTKNVNIATQRAKSLRMKKTMMMKTLRRTNDVDYL